MIDRTKQFSAVPSDTAVPSDKTELDVPATAELDARPAARRGLRLPAGGRRPAFFLAAAAAGALVVNVLAGGQPAAEADAETSTVSASHSVAETLGITTEAATGSAADAPAADVAAADLAPLADLAASRSEREAAEASAAQAQADAEKAELDRQAAEREAAERAAREAEARAAAEREAAERAAREAEAARAAEAPAASGGSSSSAAPRGSFKEYAMSKVGSADQFSCLENLWGKESGWNPNAQNPTSTAYGIPQFLNSTWAGTGIAKTSDGYRQIDAGLIYIENRYGSPCAAWAHSKANNWY
ncbi:lytic transglycosylase domain-containing protein [Geodermatophilus sp. CPCC 205761]|uniref:aggregation-promoting factor C-terminal-like domain-containing protein n=1 Tax=Geodermatophilus sp. CPCC 205761 TaxID=2936597 RepID=UPI003EE93623